MGDTSPDNKPFVRSAETKGKGQRYKLTSAFSNAGRGLFEAVRSERNLRIDACMAVVAIALGFGLRVDTPSWLAVIVCIGMMFALETVNNQYLGGGASLACSAETQTKIDQRVVELVKKQHEKAIHILTENRAKLDELAQYLYEKETITGEEFMKIVNEK